MVTPFVACLVAILVFWGHGVSWLDLGLAAVMYSISIMGITLGFHRLFTHRAFKCALPVRAALCIAGSTAAQGPVLFWSACHRRHHQFSDREGDPHSPHLSDHGAARVLKGWWHAHVGWMFSHPPENYVRRVPDLIRDRAIVALNRAYLPIVFGSILLPGVIAFAITRHWQSGLTAILWAGLVRIFLVHHTTWSINSVCHLFGTRPYDTADQSRNNVICAILTFGEGWHNNHHAFPASASLGLRWWQVDFGFFTIRILKALGLVWDVRLPSAEQIANHIQTSMTPDSPRDSQQGRPAH